MLNPSPLPILLLAVWFLAPGLAWSVLWTVGSGLSPLSTIALALPVGIMLVAAVGFILALVGALTPVTAALAWIALTAVGWILAIRRGDAGEGWRSGVAQARRAPVMVGLGAALLLALGVVRATFGLDRNLAPTALRYWADGVEIADAGGFPHSVLHWGLEVPPTMSKVLLNVLYAQERFFLGREPLPPLAASLFLVSIALILIVAAVSMEAGLHGMGLAVVVVVVGATALPGLVLAADLRTLVAEDWGRTLAFASLIPALGAFRATDRDRGRRSAIFAGVLLGAAAGVHLVAALGGAVLIGGSSVGFAIASGRWRSVGTALVTVAAISVVIEASVLLAAPGELGFQGAGGDAAYDAVRQELGEPPSFDPVVWLVTEGHTEHLEAVPRDPISVMESLGAKLVGRGGRADADAPSPLPLVSIAMLCLVSLAVVLALTDRQDLRSLAFGSVAALLAFSAIAVGFALRYETFALANFGVRRMSQYFGFALLMLVAAAAESVVGLLSARRRLIVGGVIAMLAAAVVLPSMRAEPRTTARADIAAFGWIARHVPCEGRVLLDRRSLASVEALAGRAGVLEGMGPHLRPSLLAPAIEEMQRARRFLMHPGRGAPYLRAEGIAAVMIADERQGHFGAWHRIAPIDPERFADVPFLHEAYAADGITIYTVDGWTPPRGLPAVRGRPGYAC